MDSPPVENGQGGDESERVACIKRCCPTIAAFAAPLISQSYPMDPARFGDHIHDSDVLACVQAAREVAFSRQWGGDASSRDRGVTRDTRAVISPVDVRQLLACISATMDRVRECTCGWAVALFIPKGASSPPLLLYSVHPGVAEKAAERGTGAALSLEDQLLRWILRARDGRDAEAEGVVCAPLFVGDLLGRAAGGTKQGCRSLRKRLMGGVEEEVEAAMAAFDNACGALSTAPGDRDASAAATMEAMRTATQQVLRVLEGARERRGVKRGVLPKRRASLAVVTATESWAGLSLGAPAAVSLSGHILRDHTSAWTAANERVVRRALPALARAVDELSTLSLSHKHFASQQCRLAQGEAWARCLEAPPASSASGPDAVLRREHLASYLSALGMHHLLFASGKWEEAGPASGDASDNATGQRFVAAGSTRAAGAATATATAAATRTTASADRALPPVPPAAAATGWPLSDDDEDAAVRAAEGASDGDAVPCHLGGVFRLKGSTAEGTGCDLVFVVANTPGEEGEAPPWVCVVAKASRIPRALPPSAILDWSCDVCEGAGPHPACPHADAILDRFGYRALYQLADAVVSPTRFRRAPPQEDDWIVPVADALVPFVGTAEGRGIRTLAPPPPGGTAPGGTATVGWAGLGAGNAGPPRLRVLYSAIGDLILRLGEGASTDEEDVASLLRAHAEWSEPFEADSAGDAPAPEWAALWQAALKGKDINPVAITTGQAHQDWLRAPEPSAASPVLTPPCPRCGGTELVERGGADRLRPSEGREPGTESRVLLIGSYFHATIRPLACSRCGAKCMGREGHPLLVHAGGADFVGLDVIAMTNLQSMAAKTSVRAASSTIYFLVLGSLRAAAFEAEPRESPEQICHQLLKAGRERFAQLIQPHMPRPARRSRARPSTGERAPTRPAASPDHVHEPAPAPTEGAASGPATESQGRGRREGPTEPKRRCRAGK